ncbi:MAG: hypothetical protein GF331_10270, partial [Chitinivibrionales bacterium]|nr:hypothetical protein [Chitinivibrionales bacterium]
MSRSGLRRLSLQYRLLLPNALLVVLVAVAAALYLRSESTVGRLKAAQQHRAELSRSVRELALKARGWLDGGVSYDALRAAADDLTKTAQGSHTGLDPEALWENITEIRTLRLRNNAIDEEVWKLTGTSMDASNTFIQQVSERLADPARKGGVTRLERLVLAGANTNTTASLETRVRFKIVRTDLDTKDDLRQFLKLLLENVERDVESLRGTQFQQLALSAREANTKIAALAEEFIANEERVSGLKKRVFNSVEAAVDHIDEQNTAGIVSFASSVQQTLLTVIVVIVLIALFIGTLSAFMSSRVAHSLRNVINVLGNGSSQLNSASGQLTSASQQTSEAASELASGLEETSSSLEEMASMTARTAQDAREANKAAAEGSSAAARGQQAMSSMEQTIREIKTSSDETAIIVKGIDEIAMQTNLLALNAAVEAARG